MNDTIEQLRQSLADENISWGELAEIDQMATEAGITVTDEMLAGDILDAIVDKIERRERIRQGMLSHFETGLRYHLANNPDTWHVVKRAERCWHVVNGAGDSVGGSSTTKRHALELLQGNGYRRSWLERDEWYRGTSNDPRNRAFAADEQAIIDRVLGETAAAG